MVIVLDNIIAFQFYLSMFAFSSQDVPISPHVEYQRPQVSDITATYDCFGSDVRLDIASSDGGLTLTSFENGSGKATIEQLERWNGWLEGMSLYSAHWIGCQSNDRQSIMISGSKHGELATRVVTVWWHGQRMGVISRLDQLPGNVIVRLPTD